MLTTTLLSLVLGVAQADVPSIGIETCTASRRQQAGTTCVECRSWHGADREGEQSCADQYKETDYSYVCQTSGASVWTEVWCDGPTRSGSCLGCATGTAGTNSGQQDPASSGVSGLSWGLGLGMIGLLALRRRG